MEFCISPLSLRLRLILIIGSTLTLALSSSFHCWGPPGRHHGPQHHKEQTHQRPRQRPPGPAARARDAARRATWLRKQEERQQAAPAEETLENSEPADAAPQETLKSSETIEAVIRPCKIWASYSGQ